MKRAGAQVLLFLAVGAVASVLLAWLVAMFGNVRGYDFRDPLNPGDRLLCGQRIPDGWDCRTLLVESGFGVDYEMATELQWLGSSLLAEYGGEPQRSIERISLGWPRRCLVFATGMDHVASGASDSRRWFLLGLESPRRATIARSIPRRLPTQPLWAGLAIDSLVFGGAAWALYLAAVQARAWSRTRRGLCHACAYPVGHSSTCPECGRPAPTRAVPSSGTPDRNSAPDPA